ncbi:Imm53 family immunity protein [Streptomyces sp. NPDC051445]|uniref:Imm53 family immunity protein n=1 Tax=unclassified Streptomyces TaxID=2593676 RepID=UPI00379E314E
MSPKTGKSLSGALEENQGLHFIQSWYESNCDGDWEHEFGIRMATTDNPGWHIEIDVSETNLEGVLVERVRRETSNGGWVIAWSDGKVFQAACSPLLLGEVDEFFRQVAEGSAAVAGESSA